MKLIDPHATVAEEQRERSSFGSNWDDLDSMEAEAYFESNPLESTLARTAKRTVDLALAITFGVLFLPLLVVIAAAIKCFSRGPIFYSQVRLGHDGKPFRMWKFRTMVMEAERRLEEHLLENPALHQEWNTNFKLKHDPRIIPWVGRALRKSSMDELPQLWNVILGEMSFVGPRPLPQYHLYQFEDEFLRLRASMPPGITGQWQVCSRKYGAPEMFQKWDTYYIRNWSIWLDLRILSRTPWIVFSGKGAG